MLAEVRTGIRRGKGEAAGVRPARVDDSVAREQVLCVSWQKVLHSSGTHLDVDRDAELRVRRPLLRGLVPQERAVMS